MNIYSLTTACNYWRLIAVSRTQRGCRVILWSCHGDELRRAPRPSLFTCDPAPVTGTDASFKCWFAWSSLCVCGGAKRRSVITKTSTNTSEFSWYSTWKPPGGVVHSHVWGYLSVPTGWGAWGRLVGGVWFLPGCPQVVTLLLWVSVLGHVDSTRTRRSIRRINNEHLVSGGRWTRWPGNITPGTSRTSRASRTCRGTGSVGNRKLLRPITPQFQFSK